jgi:hypothetical protein
MECNGMRIKLTLTEKELDLLIRLLDEEIDDISELKAKLQIYRKCGEVFLSKNTNDGDVYED